MGGSRNAIPAEGLRRVIIEGVEPEIDCGQFPIKRTRGESVVVEADVFTDGHDSICCYLLYRREKDKKWTEVPMVALPNDRWRGAFTVAELGYYRYTLVAFAAPFKTWRRDLVKRVAAEQDLSVDLMVGADLLEESAARATGAAARKLHAWALLLRGDEPQSDRARAMLAPEVEAYECAFADRTNATQYARELRVWVDRERARYSTWYELFPRSTAREPGRHGTFADCEAMLPYVAGMGFDVLYLPPIHPIGATHRKGRNNTLRASPRDVGSPWAIGSPDGGHKAIHRQLGTLEDFRHLVAEAAQHGLEIALDIAYQVSPDHPYVHEHPEWFRMRPDGTIQYAENPPKKYQDIYPFDFDTAAWKSQGEELKTIFDFWIEQGVRIFRVDNPHTKAFPFWEWALGELRKSNPDVILLSEAFTRPRIMYRLAKIGFTQSYTYFAWRNTKEELTEYFTELTTTEVREYFRPNLWPNTPDILTELLQTGGRVAFMMRLVLAATLGASYGIYGPAFELLEHTPRELKSEEYLDSEKYEIKQWKLDDPLSLHDFIQRVNQIRRDNVALQSDRTLRFHRIDNDQIIAYSKKSDDPPNLVVVIVNLDPKRVQAGWVELPLGILGISEDRPYEVHDVLADARYSWKGAWNYIELRPDVTPAHIFRIDTNGA